MDGITQPKLRGLALHPNARRKEGTLDSRRPNIWAVRVGYWWGRGYSAKVVAEFVGEDTTEATVKGMVRSAGVMPETPRHPIIPIELPSWQRDIIARHAAARGLTLHEIIGQVIESTLVLDDLYDAVTDGRY